MGRDFRHVGEEQRKGVYREAPKFLILHLDICVFVQCQNDMIIEWR